MLIELTDSLDGKPALINVENITSIKRYSTEITPTKTVTGCALVFSDNSSMNAEESYNEIKKLLLASGSIISNKQYAESRARVSKSVDGTLRLVRKSKN